MHEGFRLKLKKPLSLEEMAEAAPNILTIAGEQVALSPTGLPKSESIMVSFDTNYVYPGMTEEEKASLKEALQQLFGGSGILLGTSTPPPPCSDTQKTLLIKSLTHRFGVLRNTVLSERSLKKDTLRLRQLTEQLQKLKSYIQYLSTTTDPCRDLEETEFRKLEGLDDEKIKQLLQQFIFFILQGINPLEAYAKIAPGSEAFVSKLEKNPIRAFPAFLSDYRNAKAPIPERIAKVLQVTDLDLNAIKAEIATGIQKKTAEVLDQLKAVLPPLDPFWKGLNKQDIKAIIDRLLQRIQELIAAEKACKERIQRLEAELNASSIKDIKSSGDVRVLQEKIDCLERELAEAKKHSESITTNTASLQSAMAAAKREIDTLKQSVKDLQEENGVLNSIIRQLESELTSGKDQLKELQDQLKGLEATNQELTRLRAENDTLRNRIRQLEEAAGKTASVASDYSAIVAERDRLQTELATLKARCDTNEQQISSLQEDIRRLTEERDSLRDTDKGEIDSLNSRIAELQTQLTNLTAEKTQREEQIEKRTKDLTTALSRLVEQNKRVKALESENAKFLLEVERLQKELSLVQQKTVEDKEAERVSAERSLKLMDVEWNEKLAALQTQIQEKNGIINTLRSQMKDQVGSQSDIQNQLVQSQKEKQELEQQLAKALQDMAEKTKQFEDALRNAQAEADQQKEQLSKEIDGRKEVIQNLRKNAVQLQLSLEKAEANLSSTQLDVEQKDRDLESKDQKLSSLEETVSRLHGQLQESTDRLSELETQIAALEAERNALQSSATGAQETVAELARFRTLAEQTAKQLQDSQETVRQLREQSLADQETKRKELADLEAKKDEECKNRIEALQTANEEQKTQLRSQLETLESQFNEQIQQKQSELDALQNRENDLQANISQKDEQIASLMKQLTELQESIAAKDNSYETLQEKVKAETFRNNELMSILQQIADWMSGTGDKPSINPMVEGADTLESIIQKFEGSRGRSSSMNATKFDIRTNYCYLVFMASYMMARHFPKRTDADSPYQSRIQEVLEGVLATVLGEIQSGKLGSLQAKPGGEITPQQASKYLMDLLIKILNRMEDIHKSGLHGVYVYKYAIFTPEELAVLKELNLRLREKIALKGRDLYDAFDNYVLRRTGNVDDDITKFDFRFVDSSPVFVFMKKDTKDLEGLTKYTTGDGPVVAASKVDGLTATAISKEPRISFYWLFYVFLFSVRDYLYSIEGELKDVCPLPTILRKK
jgi:DNA repair exonuclease SbcCD ATPase subunit